MTRPQTLQRPFPAISDTSCSPSPTCHLGLDLSCPGRAAVPLPFFPAMSLLPLSRLPLSSSLHLSFLLILPTAVRVAFPFSCVYTSTSSRGPVVLYVWFPLNAFRSLSGLPLLFVSFLSFSSRFLPFRSFWSPCLYLRSPCFFFVGLVRALWLWWSSRLSLVRCVSLWCPFGLSVCLVSSGARRAGKPTGSSELKKERLLIFGIHPEGRQQAANIVRRMIGLYPHYGPHHYPPGGGPLPGGIPPPGSRDMLRRGFIYHPFLGEPRGPPTPSFFARGGGRGGGGGVEDLVSAVRRG